MISLNVSSPNITILLLIPVTVRFSSKLNAAIENVEQSIHDQTQGNSARLEAATAIQHTRSEAVGALRRFDPVMDSLLSNDPPVLAVWQRARRIERATGVAKPVEGRAPTPLAPVTA